MVKVSTPSGLLALPRTGLRWGAGREPEQGPGSRPPLDGSVLLACPNSPPQAPFGRVTEPSVLWFLVCRVGRG